MAVLPEAVVEIAPSERSPLVSRQWIFAAAVLGLIIGLVVIIAITRPTNPALQWERQMGPTGPVNLDSLVATSDGFALLSGVTADGVGLWSSSDGASWDYEPLQGSPSQLAAMGIRLLAYEVDGGRILTPAAEGWVEGDELDFPDEIRSRQGSGRQSLVADDEGFVVTSILGDVWWSADGSEFDIVVADPEWGPGQAVEVPFDSGCRPPTRISPDVPPILTTESGFAALISSNSAEPFGIWPVCEPQLMFSADGRSWTRAGTPLGDGAYVYNMAWRDQRFTAVGGTGIGRSVAWTSTDGRVWDPIDNTFALLSGVDLYTVQAGPAGWVILGEESEDSSPVGWTSTDGLCWTALPAEVVGSGAAVSEKMVMVVDRITYPETWVATATGGTGTC
jgi:hypothetical protein